jgi:hypothetical protein
VEEIKTGDGDAEQKAQIRLDETRAETSYANFFLVSTGLEEIALSFGVRGGDGQTVLVRDKIILSPKNFKRMVAAVSQSLKMYEERVGAVDISLPNIQEPPRK